MQKTVLFFTAILLLTSLKAYCQDDDHYTLDLREEVITVVGIDSGFYSQVAYYGNTGTKGGTAFVHKSGVDKIEDLNVGYFKKNNQIKNIRRLEIEDLSYTSSFYSDERIYVFDLPEDKHFKYNYLRKNNQLPFLASLRFGISRADTEIYIVKVPLDLNIKYRVEDTATLVSFEQKITKYQDYTEYYFRGIVDSTKHTGYLKTHQTSDLLTTKPFPYPSVRLFITPKEYAGKEEQYFNKWLTDLVAPTESMSTETKNIIDQTIGQVKDRDSIIEILFNMVKSKIRYICIHTGLGGFQPHEVDYILAHKQGDCKDMANLMCQSLRYAGIDANLAVSSTLSHRFAMDFPSLSSGNHMVCVAKDKTGNQLFLDPTETEGVYYNPSRQIQGTSLFVFGENQGYFLDVPKVSADSNRIYLRYDLSVGNKKLTGRFRYEFNSLAALQIKTWYNEFSNDQFKVKMMAYLTRISPRMNYADFEVESNENSITVSGNVEIPKSAYTTVGDKKYLLISFLPLPHPFGNDLKEKTNYVTYSTINTQLDLYLYTQSYIEEVYELNTQLEEGQLKFALQATSEDQVLHVNYQYQYDEVEIDADFASKFIQFDRKIKDVFNKVVVFK